MISQNKSLWCAEEETSLDLQGMSLSEEDIKVQIIIFYWILFHITFFAKMYLMSLVVLISMAKISIAPFHLSE